MRMAVCLDGRITLHPSRTHQSPLESCSTSHTCPILHPDFSYYVFSVFMYFVFIISLHFSPRTFPSLIPRTALTFLPPVDISTWFPPRNNTDTFKPVLSGHPWKMGKCPFNTGCPLKMNFGCGQVHILLVEILQ